MSERLVELCDWEVDESWVVDSLVLVPVLVAELEVMVSLRLLEVSVKVFVALSDEVSGSGVGVPTIVTARAVGVADVSEELVSVSVDCTTVSV